jgi:hypothetical protein
MHTVSLGPRIKNLRLLSVYTADSYDMCRPLATRYVHRFFI